MSSQLVLEPARAGWCKTVGGHGDMANADAAGAAHWRGRAARLEGAMGGARLASRGGPSSRTPRGIHHTVACLGEARDALPLEEGGG